VTRWALSNERLFTKMLFQRRNLSGDRSLTENLLAGDGRKRAGLDDAG
jgi:hypothetical protein